MPGRTARKGPGFDSPAGILGAKRTAPDVSGEVLGRVALGGGAGFCPHAGRKG